MWASLAEAQPRVKQVVPPLEAGALGSALTVTIRGDLPADPVNLPPRSTPPPPPSPGVLPPLGRFVFRSAPPQTSWSGASGHLLRCSMTRRHGRSRRREETHMVSSSVKMFPGSAVFGKFHLLNSRVKQECSDFLSAAVLSSHSFSFRICYVGYVWCCLYSNNFY